MCVCAVCTAKGTLSQLHCAITKLETCKKLFFICTVHITRLCVNRDNVFSTHRTTACRDISCAFNVVCVHCMYLFFVNCVSYLYTIFN